MRKGIPGITNAVLGGWQLSGKFEWQTGQPMTWANVYYDSACGDASDLTSRWGSDNGQKLGVDVPFFDTSCFLAPTSAAFGRITNIDSSTMMKTRDYQLGVRVTF